jgi:hypothetical protein
MAYTTFHVTEDDIQQGHRENCTRCPVARAISREVGQMVYVVGINGLTLGRVEYLTGDGRRVVQDLPKKIGEKILCYDRTGVMAPFVFALKVEGDGLRPHHSRALDCSGRVQGSRETALHSVERCGAATL